MTLVIILTCVTLFFSSFPNLGNEEKPLRDE